MLFRSPPSRKEEEWKWGGERGKQRTRYSRDVARCDVGEMSFLERADGRERVWNRNKEACGGGSFEQMKENVSYDAGHKHHLYFFFFQFLLQLLLQLLLPPFSSHIFFSTSSYCLFIFPPFSPTSWPPSSLLLTIAPACQSFSLFLFLFLLFAAVLHLFSCVLFLLRCFFFFIIRFLSLPPFTSSPTTKHVVNLLRFALRLLLAAHPGVRIAVIKFRRSLSMFA